MAVKIQIRRDTTSNWTSNNPVLAQGEIGWDTVLKKGKVGDGSTAWSSLDFSIGTATDTSNKANIDSPTFTGTVTIPTLLLTISDTVTEATHYMVETGSDGIVRPKTLSDVKQEVVTTSAVNSAAATTVGTITSGTWQGSTISETYLDSSVARLASPTFTGTPSAPTAAAGTNTTQIATTSFVMTADSLKADIASPTFTGTVTSPKFVASGSQAIGEYRLRNIIVSTTTPGTGNDGDIWLKY